MKLLVIIPARNEAKSLPRLLGEVRCAGYDAIIVNDDSRDATGAVSEDADYPVLTLPVNLGVGGGVQTGFLYAVRHGYDIAVQVDGDGQHDPSQIPALIAPILLQRADCVIGSRYLPRSEDLGYKTPLVRRIGMYFSSYLLRAASGLMIYDTTSGFRALNRRAFSYFSMSYPVDHPEAEALLMLHQRGLRIVEIPTRMRFRTTGQTLFTAIRATLYPFRVVIGFLAILLKGHPGNVS